MTTASDTQTTSIEAQGIRTALNQYLLRIQPAVALTLGIFGGSFAILEAKIRAVEIVVPAVGSDLAIGFLGFFVWAMLRMRSPSASWAHPIGFGLAVVALTKNLLTIILTGDPGFTSVTSISTLAVALLLFSTRWYLLYLVTTLLSWGWVGTYAIANDFAFAHAQPLFVSSFFGVLINVAVVRILSNVERLRQENEQQRADLAAALDSAREEIVRRAAAEERAEKANESRTHFLANMSHELRTPLNSIIGYSEMLELMAARAGHPEYLKDLNRIYVSGHHLLDLINDILDLSKVEAGRMDLVIEEFDPGRIALEVLEMVTPLASKNGNQLDSHLPPELPTMTSDAGRLRQVLLNLLGNACKFTQNGTIDLEVLNEPDADPPEVAFVVRDTGIGMTPEQLETIFRPFAQADATTARRYGGTGLGLSIARTMAERLGGRIDVSSEYGKGSTFTLHVPLTPDNAPPAVSALEDSQPLPKA